MRQGDQSIAQPTLGGGLCTFSNVYEFPQGATPACMDVKVHVDGSVSKRPGQTSMNSVAIISSAATGFNPDAGGTLATALRAYWKLNEGSDLREDSFGRTPLTPYNSPAATTGKVGAANLFTASSTQYLARAHTSAFSFGDTDFAYGGWLYLTSTQDAVVLGKINPAWKDYEYKLAVRTDGTLLFYASSCGFMHDGVVAAGSFGALSTATWYNFVAWHDAGNNKLGLSVNLSATTAAYTKGVTTANAPLFVGAVSSGTYTGFIPDSAGTIKATATAYWRMEEASGTRLDVVGTNNLSVAGTVGTSAGIVGSAAAITNWSSYLYRDNDAVNAVSSQSYTFSGWFFMTSKNTIDSTIVSKDKESGGDYGFKLIYEVASDRFAWYVRNSADSAWAVTSGGGIGAPSLNTWYLLTAWHDSAGQVIGLQVNTAAATSAALIGGGRTNDERLRFGMTELAGGANSYFAHGRFDEWGFWKGVVLNPVQRECLWNRGSANTYKTHSSEALNGRVDELCCWAKVPTAAERSDLYNSGNANTYNLGFAAAGLGVFDFGAYAAGIKYRWLVVSTGTGVYASSARGVGFTTIATDRTVSYQNFERSKTNLIMCSDSNNKVLYWDGSPGVYAVALAPGSSPPCKYPLDYAGYLLLMNNSGGNGRSIYYAPNNSATTDAWTKTFEVASSYDDEITGGAILANKAYISTKYTMHRVTFVGGNPDFAEQTVKNWGAVPRTIKRASYKDVGEVIICFGYDKHVRIFDGVEDKIISTSIEEDNSITEFFLRDVNENAMEKCHAEVDIEEQVYRLWVPVKPNTEVSHCICLNLRNGAWYPYVQDRGNSIVAATMAESANARVLIGVRRDGYVVNLNSGNTDDGIPIDEYIYTPMYMANKDPSRVIKQSKVVIVAQPTSAGTLYYQEAYDFSRSFKTRDKIILDGTSGNYVEKRVIDIPTTVNVYQGKITSSSGTAEPWIISQFDVKGMVMGGGAA